MAKRTGKNCSPVTSGNVFIIKVPADAKTIIVVSPKIDKPYIKCEKAIDSDSTAVQNNRVSMADELITTISTDSDGGEDEFIFGR